MESSSNNLRALVFLNNTAVTLLSRNCYEQARVTLNHALDLTKLISCPSPSPPLQNQNNQVVQGMIREADHRLANSVPATSGNTPGQGLLGNTQVQVISDGESLDLVSPALLGGDSSPQDNTFYLIQMDPDTIFGEEDNSQKGGWAKKKFEVGVEASTILFNYGMILILLAKTTKSHQTLSSNSSRVQDHLRAFRLLQLSYASLSGWEDNAAQCSCDNFALTGHFHRRLLVKLIILRQLVNEMDYLVMDSRCCKECLVQAQSLARDISKIEAKLAVGTARAA